METGRAAQIELDRHRSSESGREMCKLQCTTALIDLRTSLLVAAARDRLAYRPTSLPSDRFPFSFGGAECKRELEPQCRLCDGRRRGRLEQVPS
jgi:hypothetical protein